MDKIEIMRQIQADSLVFFMKVHNYHWNAKGNDFPNIHKMTEEVYEAFSGIFDETAERVLQLGSVPITTLTQVISTTKLKEDPKVRFVGKDVLQGILEDYKHFLRLFRDLSKCSEGDIGTQDYANAQVTRLEKAIWMTESQLA